MGQPVRPQILFVSVDKLILCCRCTLHRVIPGTYETVRRGIRTTVFGEKRKLTRRLVLMLIANNLSAAYFDPASESRNDHARRQKLAKTNGVANGHANGVTNGISNGVH